MNISLLDVPISPIERVVDVLPYIVIGLLIAGAIAVSVVLIVHFSKKKKK
ncbi:MAG: hypothetical protein K6F68_05465 [Clostridiales bacterium]|nr:hypothetical protein [Clostridiales bacterium]